MEALIKGLDEDLQKMFKDGYSLECIQLEQIRRMLGGVEVGPKKKSEAAERLEPQHVENTSPPRRKNRAKGKKKTDSRPEMLF